jgi:prepilin-type N-terminal cleavage/methylation domain-containing protein
MKSPFTNRRFARVEGGFTLIELLVVIAIIALLAALLIPGIRSMRESTNAATSISNLRQMGAAMHLYVIDNKGMLPRADGRNSDVGLDWATALRAYGASHRLPEPQWEQNPLLINPAGVSPEYPAAGVKSSYSMNGNLQVNHPPPDGDPIGPVDPIALVSVKTPTKTVLFADMLYAGRAMNYSHVAYRCMNNTKATMVFIDGHAEARSKDALSYEANFAQPPLN